jgi:hypothetical protein
MIEWPLRRSSQEVLNDGFVGGSGLDSGAGALAALHPSIPLKWEKDAPSSGQSAYDWGWDRTVIRERHRERRVTDEAAIHRAGAG